MKEPTLQVIKYIVRECNYPIDDTTYIIARFDNYSNECTNKPKWVIIDTDNIFSKSLRHFIEDLRRKDYFPEFLEDTRFDTAEEAFETYKKWLEEKRAK